MNWFFHKVYWTGWISIHTRRKKELMGGAGVGRLQAARDGKSHDLTPPAVVGTRAPGLHLVVPGGGGGGALPAELPAAVGERDRAARGAHRPRPHGGRRRGDLHRAAASPLPQDARAHGRAAGRRAAGDGGRAGAGDAARALAPHVHHPRAAPPHSGVGRALVLGVPHRAEPRRAARGRRAGDRLASGRGARDGAPRRKQRNCHRLFAFPPLSLRSDPFIRSIRVPVRRPSPG